MLRFRPQSMYQGPSRAPRWRHRARSGAGVTLLATIALVSAACSSKGQASPVSTTTTAAPTTTRPIITTTTTPAAPTTISVPLGVQYPVTSLTPGATVPGVGVATLCSGTYLPGFPQVPGPVRNLVFMRYGIGPHDPAAFVIDRLIPPGLGGSNDPANLWPMSTAAQYNQTTKARLDFYLHSQVCAGKLDLGYAQHAVVTNWWLLWATVGRP